MTELRATAWGFRRRPGRQERARVSQAEAGRGKESQGEPFGAQKNQEERGGNTRSPEKPGEPERDQGAKGRDFSEVATAWAVALTKN